MMKNASYRILLLVLFCGLAAGQTYKVLYAFQGAQAGDGAAPVSGLIFDQSGNLYGTTRLGGATGGGSVFELTPNLDGTWAETVLYSFCTDGVICLDGYQPEAGLTFDALGNLYGTTFGGGSCQNLGGSCGTVFELSPPVSGTTWTERVLWSFCSNLGSHSCLDGNAPKSQLIWDASGNLYGTTSQGGSGHGKQGPGVVFELSPGASGWTENVLYNFCSLSMEKYCPDGTAPLAGVTFNALGDLYGTTSQGGRTSSYGGGTVYKLVPGASGWTESVLFAFPPPSQGAGFPSGAVSFDLAGNPLSTASGGGASNAGSAFRLNLAKGTKSSFYFNVADGAQPSAGLLVDVANNALYGTTWSGGLNSGGKVFKLVAPRTQIVLYNFCSEPSCADGAGSLSDLVEDAAGNIYGTTEYGGSNNNGVVFEITP